MAEVVDTKNESKSKGGASAKPAGGFLAGKDPKSLVMIGLASCAILFLLFQFFCAPKYQTLYSNLEQSDAAAIGSYLEKNKIKFQISPDGESIQVAGASVAKVRLELASKGLPKGSGVGFELFDKANLNISDFNQKINYNRALEGELARTISSLESVKSAKVHLVLPKKSIFKEQAEEAKASVILTTEYGAKLSDSQIKGIQHLVSSAIEGLKAQNVQITDQDGNSLVKFIDPNSLEEEKQSANEKKTRDFEAKLENDLNDMLATILGKGNVLVNVSAEMNFDESEINIEMYSPEVNGVKANPVLLSEKTITEKYSNQQRKSFGTVGTQNNMPNFVRPNPSSNPSNENRDYVKEDATKNYEISKSIERIRRATGLLKKISVAVVVNKDLSPSERSTLRQTVQVAAGLNMDRGDQVIVTGIRFSSTPYSNISDQEARKHLEEVDRQARLKKYLSLALVVAVGLAVIMIVMFSMTASIDSKRSKEIDELLKEEDIPILSTIDEKIQEAEEAYHRQLSLEGNRSVASMKEGLSQMALQDPKTIARGLQAYISD